VPPGKNRHATLLPFDEWCAVVNPTEAAKELYWFAVHLLEERERRDRTPVATASRSRSTDRKHTGSSSAARTPA
jgi:hypothetical protein